VAVNLAFVINIIFICELCVRNGYLRLYSHADDKKSDKFDLQSVRLVENRFLYSVFSYPRIKSSN